MYVESRRISHSYIQPNLILWVAPLSLAAKVNAHLPFAHGALVKGARAARCEAQRIVAYALLHPRVEWLHPSRRRVEARVASGIATSVGFTALARPGARLPAEQLCPARGKLLVGECGSRALGRPPCARLSSPVVRSESLDNLDNVFEVGSGADDEGVVDGLSAERVLREGVAEP